MKKYDLNNLPNLMAEKKLTRKEVVDYLAQFILENKPLFQLQNQDEDFTSEIILKFLENSDRFLDSFNAKLGGFSSYFYSFVLMSIHSEKRSKYNKNFTEIVFFDDSAFDFEENQENTKLQLIKETPKIPYSYTPITSQDFKSVFLSKISKEDKKILVSAVRSAIDLSDTQIQIICQQYNIQSESFYQIIEQIKTELEKKAERRQQYIERRNSQYFFHRRYELQLKCIDELDFINEPEKLKIELKRKEQKHKESWKNINKKLNDGYLHIRPSSKTIAEILGICERQVCYYLYCIKHSLPDEDSPESVEDK